MKHQLHHAGFSRQPKLNKNQNHSILIKGGVEDTRLEAQAKNTKKNPRLRPRTALPRTDPLEVKDRNARGQGHRRNCSPNKKVFKKVFQAISKRGKQKGFRKFFARFLAFSYIILKMNKPLLLQETMQMHITVYGDPPI